MPLVWELRLCQASIPAQRLSSGSARSCPHCPWCGAGTSSSPPWTPHLGSASAPSHSWQMSSEIEKAWGRTRGDFPTEGIKKPNKNKKIKEKKKKEKEEKGSCPWLLTAAWHLCPRAGGQGWSRRGATAADGHEGSSPRPQSCCTREGTAV